MAAVTSAELTNIVGYPTIGIIFGTACVLNLLGNLFQRI